MKSPLFSALAVFLGTPPALAQTAAPAPTPVAAAGMPTPDDGFAVPNGQLGAGLSISRPTGMRAFAELGFYSIGDSFGAVDIHFTHLSLILGGGYKIAPDLEIDAALPLALLHFSAESNDPNVTITGDDSDTGYAVGNLHIGASYIKSQAPIRFKVGGAIEWGPWTIDADDHFQAAMVYSKPAYAEQDQGLFRWETLTLAAPGHIEFGDQFVGTGDGEFAVVVPTDGRDVDLVFQVDPGFGIYATPTVLVGARLPFVWVPTSSGSAATFLAIEPYGRFDFGQAFANVRLTLNIDDPYGFAFDEGKFWGLHVGGGGVF